MLKKFTSFILILTLIFSISINVFANKNQGITYEEFKKVQDEGYIGKEINYEDWTNIILLNNSLENLLENNTNFGKVYDSSEDTNTYSININSIPYLKKGDIIITNGTSSFGLTGHSAIAIGGDEILHIAGPGEKPSILNRKEFYRKYIDSWYDWIKIYRPYNSEYGKRAANWAEITYKNSNATYKINTNIFSTNETYCSKIVFQAYKFGVNTEDAFYWTYDTDTGYEGNGYYITFGIILPYNLSSLIKSDYTYKVD